MLKTLKNLVKIPSVSGHEERLSDYIKSEMLPFFDTVENDAMGNLICHRCGGGKRLMLCAHMDEIGFMVTYIGEDGYLRAAPVGGINYNAAAFSAVVFENGRHGVIVPEGGVKSEDYKADKFVIDIGAKSRGEASRLVSVGDTFTVSRSVNTLAGGRICASPLDNKLGVAALMAAAEDSGEFANDTYFVFSVQEEVGLRGAKCASFTVSPDYGIAVDVTSTGDTPGAAPSPVALGKGAAIKIKDKSAICDASLVEKMKEAARREKIPYQLEIITSGGTDTAAMQLAGSGCRAGCISIPTRYIHSGSECAALRDAEAARELISAMCRTAL